MKKIFAMCFALLFSATLFAQDEEEDELDTTFRFVYADSTEVPNGAVLNLTQLGEDITGTQCIPSGLYSENTTNSTENIRINLDIQSITEGSAIQFCALMACSNYEAVGTAYKGGLMTPNKIDDLMFEWFPKGALNDEPVEYGNAVAVLMIEHMDASGKFVLGEGPSITVNFIYADPTGINNVDAQNGRMVVARYNANGQQLTALQKGLNILKYADGTSTKILVK